MEEIKKDTNDVKEEENVVEDIKKEKDVKARTVPFMLTNLDKHIIVKCFRKDGKIRAPTKSKIYHLISGHKDNLTYSEIRYILKYIDDEYKYNVESKLKDGLWNRDLANHFNLPTKVGRLTATSFNKALGAYIEKRETKKQKETKQLMENYIKMKQEEEKLPPEETDTDFIHVKQEEIMESPIYKSNYFDLTDLDNNNEYSIYNCNSPKSIMEDTSIKSQCSIL